MTVWKGESGGVLGVDEMVGVNGGNCKNGSPSSSLSTLENSLFAGLTGTYSSLSHCSNNSQLNFERAAILSLDFFKKAS